jgi:hypothetical protein
MLSRFAFALALFAFSLSVFADTPMMRVKVVVTTLEGKPIDRASVIVQFVEGRSVVKLGKKIVTRWELRTNQDGIAKIPELPQGKIRVQVIAKQYQTFGDVFEVNEEEKTLAIKLNPPQPQVSAH